jgi:uncharacterized protein (TIGR02001 family)
MKKVVLSVVVALAVAGMAAPVFAADMPVKAKPMVAPPPPSPWDVLFGVAFTSDYDLRGVSQSNHKPAVQGYTELDFKPADWLTLYAGVWGSSLWTGFADAEFDITGGARFSVGNFGLDVGVIQYEYPGGGVNGVDNWPEVYVKPSYKVADWLTVGGVFETAFDNFNNKCVGANCSGTWVGDAGHYFVAGNLVITLPWHPAPDVNLSINPEVGYEWYSDGVNANLGFSSDTYWDVGFDINYKAITLDLRYWDTNIKDPTPVHAAQCLNNGIGNYCGSRFVATLKFDTSISALK